MALISSEYGFTVSQIEGLISNYIGNYDSEFTDYFKTSFNLLYYRFCKLHKWSWLKRNGLELSISDAVQKISLSTLATTLYTVESTNIEKIVDATNNMLLIEQSTDYFRKLDPQNASTGELKYWAVSERDSIEVYPASYTVPITLKIDAYITPKPIQNTSDYLIIPYLYQDTFIEYLKMHMMERENDDRAPIIRAQVLQMIEKDIQADIRAAGENLQDRIKSINEL